MYYMPIIISLFLCFNDLEKIWHFLIINIKHEVIKHLCYHNIWYVTHVIGMEIGEWFTDIHFYIYFLYKNQTNSKI